MADQPEVQKPTANNANDALVEEAWYEQNDMASPMTAAGTIRVAGQLALGAAKQAVEHPLETAGEVVAGAGAVAAGAYLGVTATGAAAIAAVPTAAYGIYKGVEIAKTEGVGAIPDHLKRFYDETVQTVNSKVSAMQTVFTGDSTDPKLQTAKDEVQGIGAATVPFTAGLIGGNPANGELGAQGIRMAVDVAKTAAADIARATLPMESAPALVAGTMQTTNEVSSIATGSPTISPVITAQETAVLSHSTDGDGGGEKGDERIPAEVRSHAFRVPNNRTVVSAETDPSTGKIKSECWTAPDGIEGNTIYDSNSGRTVSTHWTEKRADEGVDRQYSEEYDPNTGKLKFAVVKEGSDTTSYNFDLSSGCLQRERYEFKDGTTIDTTFDANEHPVISTRRTRSGAEIRSVFDSDPATSHPKIEDTTYADRSRVHSEVDPYTGQIRSRSIIKPDGTKSHTEFNWQDSKAEYPESAITTQGDGTVEDDKFILRHGKWHVMSRDTIEPSGRKSHTEFNWSQDPREQYAGSADTNYEDGSKVHTVFNTSTGKLESYSADSFDPDGNRIHKEFNSAERLVSLQGISPDGTTEYIGLDPETGDMISSYRISPDGTRVNEDYTSGSKLLSREVSRIHPHGTVVTYEEFDPDTGSVIRREKY